MPIVLNYLIFLGPEMLQAMWSYICTELLKAIDTEPDHDVISALMHSLAKVCV